MKKFTSSIIYLLILFLTVPNIGFSQEDEFFIDGCGNSQGFATECINGGSYVPITVSGMGTMGSDNFGIVEAYIDIDQPNYFEGEIFLVSPSGQEFLLASSVEGVSSFPEYSGVNGGEILDVGFRNCPGLPSTDSPIEPSGLDFYPVESFSSLNDGVTSANGTWNLKFCTLIPTDYIEIFCGSVTFGNLCPEITNATVTNATCPSGTNGSVTFDHEVGACTDNIIVFSVDGINYQSANSFFGLAAGDYTGYVAESIPSSSPGGEGSESSVEECITEFPFTIGTDPDSSDPYVYDCPFDQTVTLDANCDASLTLTSPIFGDNCDGITTNLIITAPDQSTSSNSFGLNASEVYNFDMPGVYTFDWIITDAAGNSASCQSLITAIDNTPPEWTVSVFEVGIECGVDDIAQTVADNLDEIFGTDGCGQVFKDFSSNPITDLCGNAQYNDWFYTLTDESGNVSSVIGQLLINVNDNLPPVISNVPADVTINCADDFPVIPLPEIDIFANDACEGDLSEAITLTSSVTFGDCTQGQAIEYHSYVYTVVDGCGNEATESFNISIFNDQAPTWEDPYSISTPVGITLECGVDDLEATIAANIPEATGCSGTIIGTVDALQIFDDCEPSEEAQQLFYTYVAIDECGNQNFTNVYFYYLDTQAPTLNGVPADVTINCNDSAPNFPTVTAIDVCQGDITEDIVYEVSTSSISCDLNQNAFIETHTWTIADACNNVQQATWTVTIFNDESVDLGDDITACVGETVQLSTSGLAGTYLWSTGQTTSSITIGNEGSYSVTVTGASGCCSIDDIVVSYQDIPDASATGGTLDCSGDDITIMGSSTSSGVSYAWTGPGGYTSSLQNPQVSQAGTYTLTVSTSAGCEATADAIVMADTNVPDISTTGGTIDCNTTEVTIMGSSSTSGVTYAWTGPNGFTSSIQNPTVSETGDYQLIITATNGCIAEGVAVVVDDTEIPTVSTTGGTIDCDNDMVTLTTTTSDSDATFSWTGPDGFTSSMQSPSVGAAGEYTVTALSDNGCINTASATVGEDIATPDLEAEGGEIDCNNDEVQLSASSSTSGVTYQWTGPNGYSSTMSEPTVDVAGEYTITIESSNGCTSMTTVTVTQNTVVPTISVSDEEIDCINSSVTLSADASDGVSFTWTGPGGFTSSEEAPTVEDAGDYIVVVTAENGCTATAEATVTENTTVPEITVDNGEIDCNNPSIQLTVTSTDNDLTYEWTGPNNFESSEQNPSVDMAGTYNVVATGENGCTTMSNVIITEDVAEPNVSADGGEINCDANTVQITGSSSTGNVEYSWTGPNDFESTAQNPEVGSPGTYTLVVTASNGCTASATAEVTADENLPNISATGGELNCNISEVQLSGSSSDSDVSFNWTGPEGFDTTDPNPTVSEAGTYTFTVTSSNGCVSEAEVTVSLDDAIPTVIALGGQISCSQTSISLIGNSTNDVSYAWTGPGGYTSTDQNPTVSDPGEYTLTVTGENGCTNATTVMVLADDDLPVAAFEDPQVDCQEDIITLSLSSDENYTYNWTFNGNVISTGESVDISEAGIYTVEVVSSNGCSINLSYELEADIVEITADISTTEATSSDNGTASINFNDENSIASILWDNGQIGEDADDLTLGMHTVTVTTIYGCVYVFEFEIKMSTAVEDIESLESFEVYPTLFQDRVNVAASFTRSMETKIYILDNTGRVMKTISPSSGINMNESIDLNELSSGVYILALHIEGQIESKRIVKM